MKKEYYYQNITSRLRRLNGITILWDNSTTFELNELGEDIWLFLENEATLEQVVKYVKNIYDVDTEMVRNDVEKFIQQLLDYNMVLVRSD